MAVLGIVELLVLEVVELWLWSGVVAVLVGLVVDGFCAEAAERSERSIVVPVCEVELCSLLPADGAAEPGTAVLAAPVLLADVSLVTGGVEPVVEAWLPLLLWAALLEELGAEPLGELAAAPVALWSEGVVELGLLLLVPGELAELLPQESEIMLTELTCRLLLSA